MKRFLTAVVATFFLLTAVAHAERVQIYDYSVNDILNDIKEIGNKRNFTIRGTHYYTGNDGFRYCESRFGDSDKNRLVFQVNNNGAVSTAWVTFPLKTLAGEWNDDSAKIKDASILSIFYVIGMSDTEIDKLVDNLNAWLNEKNKLGERNKAFSVWCGKAKRYINLKVSMKDAHTDNAVASYFIYAHN